MPLGDLWRHLQFGCVCRITTRLLPRVGSVRMHGCTAARSVSAASGYRDGRIVRADGALNLSEASGSRPRKEILWPIGRITPAALKDRRVDGLVDGGGRNIPRHYWRHPDGPVVGPEEFEGAICPARHFGERVVNLPLNLIAIDHDGVPEYQSVRLRLLHEPVKRDLRQDPVGISAADVCVGADKPAFFHLVEGPGRRRGLVVAYHLDPQHRCESFAVLVNRERVEAERLVDFVSRSRGKSSWSG